MPLGAVTAGVRDGEARRQRAAPPRPNNTKPKETANDPVYLSPMWETAQSRRRMGRSQDNLSPVWATALDPATRPGHGQDHAWRGHLGIGSPGGPAPGTGRGNNADSCPSGTGGSGSLPWVWSGDNAPSPRGEPTVYRV